MLVLYDVRYIFKLMEAKKESYSKYHSINFTDIVSYSIFKEILQDLLNEYGKFALHIIFLHESFDKDKGNRILDLFLGVKDFIQNAIDDRNRICLIKTKDKSGTVSVVCDSKEANWEVYSLGMKSSINDIPIESFIYQSKKQDIVDCACFFGETRKITIVTSDEDTKCSSIISSKGRFSVVDARNNEITSAADTKKYHTFKKAFETKHGKILV